MRSNSVASGTAIFFVACLFVACVGSRNFQVIDSAQTNTAPPYLEIYSEVSVATLHFPPGIYSLYASDSRGYYYRAPRKIIQHTASGPLPHEGGIYVRKNRTQLRGYVFVAGALTHVGNFSDLDHRFSR